MRNGRTANSLSDGRSESNRVGLTAVGAPSSCGPHLVWMSVCCLL
jgi:hypothetical protein